MANSFHVAHFKSSKNLALIVYAILGLQIIAYVLGIFAALNYLNDPDWAVSYSDGIFGSLFLLFIGLANSIRVIAFVLSAVFFLIWVHRAYSNLSPLKARNLEFSPGWAVGWWFVPFANLVKPFQVMREVWCDSDPYVATESSLFSSGPRTAPTWMGVWWGLWIVSNIFSNIAGRIADSTDVGNIVLMGWVFLFAGGLSCIAAVLCIKLVREVTTRQEQRFGNVLNMQRYSPPPPPTFASEMA